MKMASVVGGLVLALSGTVAFAHAHLQKAVPANGAVVTQAPATVELTFSEAARITAAWISKGDAPQQKVESLPTAAAKQITLTLPRLEPGSYLLTWRVVGDDKHVVPGQLRFTISGGDGAAQPGKH